MNIEVAAFTVSEKSINIKGHWLLFPNRVVFFSLKICFVLTNFVDPNEMLHLGIHCI